MDIYPSYLFWKAPESDPELKFFRHRRKVVLNQFERDAGGDLAWGQLS